MPATRVPVWMYLGSIPAIPLIMWLFYAVRCAVRAKSTSGCFGRETFDAEFDIAMLYVLYGLGFIVFFVDVVTSVSRNTPPRNTSLNNDKPTFSTQPVAQLVQHTGNTLDNEPDNQPDNEPDN